MSIRAMAGRLFRIRGQVAVAVLVTIVAGCGGTASSAPAFQAPEATPATPTAAASTSAPSAASPAPAVSASAAPDAPLGDRLVATVSLDPRPCALAATAGRVWISSYASGTLDVVDPATGTVVDRVKVGGSPCGIGVDARTGFVWVAILGVGKVVAVDPASGSIVRSIDGVGSQLWDLKVGDGAVWVVDRIARTLLRIDPATGQIRARIAIGPTGAGLALMPGAVWVADDTDHVLRRVDPGTNAVVATVDDTGGATWFADDGDRHLVAVQRSVGSIRVVDPATGAPGITAGGWKQPLDGTVVGGIAWIPDGQGGDVRVVDAETGDLRHAFALPGAHMPFVAEPAFGNVWVLDFGGSAAWVIRP